jgi:uncharacterized phage-associated protein
MENQGIDRGGSQSLKPQNTGYDCREVANYILDKGESSNIDITNLSLQKILYFCHAFVLTELSRPLVKQSFEAWQHGPVIRSLYRVFCGCGEEKIKMRATRIDKNSGERILCTASLDEELNNTLDKAIAFYGRVSAYQLVKLSHEPGGPWDKTWNHLGQSNPGMKINNNEIKEFYIGKEGNMKNRIYLN